ncbi:unnamed protein product [Clonostachys rosea f. rosea IK726]|uniref:Uncharacterized protein n=2 Tax=Bionectria ochroleuca TaxID=29856 RepID=A0A0B7KR89_BIOOC|nr:unnamed protein product [Clonostachys rosea f. rosea IK726]
MVLWIFRAVRKSLEDDGLIGRVFESTTYRTITSIRQMLFILQPLLWGVEKFFGKYAMDPMDRVMFEMNLEPDMYGPLGEALQSPAVQTLNKFMLAWFVFDMALDMLYSLLESFTLEEHEKAQRQYDKERKELGDVDDEDKAGTNMIISFTEGRIFRYVFWGVVISSLLSMLNAAGTAVSEELAYMRDTPSPEVTKANLAKINPWRDFLPEQDPVLREVVYMTQVLRQLTPTTLPEDDYQLFSDMIRSLETRTDICWRVFEETDIRQTILAAANRGSPSKPIADEPFSIHSRVKALHRHWGDLERAPGKPERWEDASDTTFLVPLIATHPFGEAETGNKAATGGGGYKLVLTPEQEADATKRYKKWRLDRDRKVSYLKIHPPTPMAWVPMSKSDTGVRNAWDSAFPDGRVQAGRSIPVGKLAGDQQWKPLFKSLITENIPFGWVTPGEEPQSAEESKAELDAMFAESDRAEERRTKQNDYIAQLKKAADERKQKSEL